MCIVLALTYPAALQADIYETTDDEGHPVFSDQPAAGAENVTPLPANVADPVAPVPATGAADSVGDATQGGAEKPTVIFVPDAHNEEVESEFRSGERHEVREAEPRREVLDAEKRHEVR
jgi:hypothetical protein